jgi:hypothetical protein
MSTFPHFPNLVNVCRWLREAVRLVGTGIQTRDARHLIAAARIVAGIIQRLK